MKRLIGFVLCAGFLAVPVLTNAQAIDLSAGSSGSSLQGAGSSLQQPVSGVQGTNPQNLTPASGLALNQTSRNPSSSSLILKPSQTSATITKLPGPKKSSKLPRVIGLTAVTIIAGFVLWRSSIKL